jgi:hypothetical protein
MFYGTYVTVEKFDGRVEAISDLDQQTLRYVSLIDQVQVGFTECKMFSSLARCADVKSR